MQNSVLQTDDRLYVGQTNQNGKPDGLGLLVDMKYQACFEGWFRAPGDNESFGTLRVINGDGKWLWTPEQLDYDKETFDFGRLERNNQAQRTNAMMTGQETLLGPKSK